ncbi:hypothetical protein ACWDSJ_35830 [Nocardia sp. NPDC003482]
MNLTSTSRTGPSDVQGWFDLLLYSAITATQAVLPAMREVGAGTLLVTNGAGSIDPTPMLGNVNPAQAALRIWALNLHKELARHRCPGRARRRRRVVGADGPPEVATAEAEDVVDPLYGDLRTHRDEAERVLPV